VPVTPDFSAFASSSSFAPSPDYPAPETVPIPVDVPSDYERILVQLDAEYATLADIEAELTERRVDRGWTKIVARGLWFCLGRFKVLNPYLNNCNLLARYSLWRIGITTDWKATALRTIANLEHERAEYIEEQPPSARPPQR
jgi:hypothetical protein